MPRRVAVPIRPVCNPEAIPFLGWIEPPARNGVWASHNGSTVPVGAFPQLSTALHAMSTRAGGAVEDARVEPDERSCPDRAAGDSVSLWSMEPEEQTDSARRAGHHRAYVLERVVDGGLAIDQPDGIRPAASG